MLCKLDAITQIARNIGCDDYGKANVHMNFNAYLSEG